MSAIGQFLTYANCTVPISGPNVTVTNPVNGHYAIGKIMDVGPWMKTDESNG
jgi:hypothetical protein